MLQGIINTVLGIWLMIAPSFMYYPKYEANIAVILGSLIATFAMISIAESVRSVRLVNVLIGVCVALSPLFLGFENMTVWVNNMLIGIMTALISLIRGRVKESFGGGWRSLFRSHVKHMSAAEAIRKEKQL